MPLNILDLLGSIANGSVNPSLNTNVTQNAQGQLTNPQGQVVGPWQRPGLFARMFSPLAQNIQQANMAYEENPLQYSQLTKELLGRGAAYQNTFPTQGAGNSAVGLGDPSAYRAALGTQAEQGNNVFQTQAANEAAQAQKDAATAPSGANPYIAQGATAQARDIIPSEQRGELLKNNILGLESGGPFTLQWNANLGRFTKQSNPMSILGGGMIGSSSLGQVQRNPSFDPNSPDSSGGGAQFTAPQVQSSVPTYTPVQPEQTRSLLGQIGAGGRGLLSSGYNNLVKPFSTPAQNGVNAMTALTGAQGAIAPTEQDVDAARNQLLSNGKRVSIIGGYEMDKDGNIYHNGKFVNEQQLEGTPMASIRQKLLGIHKDLKAHIANSNLPHNQ